LSFFLGIEHHQVLVFRFLRASEAQKGGYLPGITNYYSIKIEEW
jgi:hypothetical protein